MASMTTIASSFLGTSATAVAASKQLPTSARRGAVVVRASSDSEKMEVKVNSESSNTRRDWMFGVAAAALCSVAKVAMADEPKRGTLEAKKKYAPICVTMPTARICHK